ncbi:unnamed protein product [Medioppia subpectinata]|uniref:Uncharacterized protein n=1 Tax=Medioppia subpectinata TaxID=1979941 RepID=A0A7R9KLV8_9ACAR|nr:unnamed protein product [Medioppia subpectinata]CAG2106007.1 unnamed protein product [Medioppia subpectinata]
MVELNNNNKCDHKSTEFSISPESENKSNVFDLTQSEDTDHTISSPSTSSPEEIPNNETLLLTENTIPANDEAIDNLSVVSGDGYQSDNWSVASHKQQQR